MKKRIVIISEYFYPNNRTDANLLLDISKKLYEVNDENIQVICTSSLNGKSELSFLKNKIIRLKSIKLNDNNLIARIFKFLLLTIKLSTKAIVTIKKDDRVLITTNPAFLVPIISLFRKFRKFEYTLLVYDVFPENLGAAGIISSNKLFYKIVKKIYDWSYSSADKIVVIGRDMNDVVSSKTKNKVPITLIENWCDINTIKEEDKSRNKILNDLKIVNKKVFLFAGNLGRVQGIETLLKAASLVQDKEFVLLFIGDGAYKNNILDYIKTNKACNVFYAGNFPFSRKNEFLNACDVAIISLSKSMYGLGVPSKSYTNMASSKPLLYIGDNKSEISLLVKEHNIGWTIEPGNIEKLSALIDKICIESNNFNIMGKKSRKIVETYYSKDIILNKYKKLYED
ncbi:MAG: hypothetical protein COA66_07090 [Arcobacter sp.]|nr:MAG: hypothetical protein COA66_07090 [Arcobacter sp.]